MHPRTCIGCKALHQNSTTITCLLGFPLKVEIALPLFTAKPAIPELSCPKPRTYTAFVKASLGKQTFEGR